MEYALAFTLFSASFGAPQERALPDGWFTRDKVLHFGVSAAIQLAGHTILRANGYEYRDAAWTAGAPNTSAIVIRRLPVR